MPEPTFVLNHVDNFYYNVGNYNMLPVLNIILVNI